MKEPLFPNAQEDYELDPDLSDYLWSRLRKHGVHRISFDTAYSSGMYDVAYVTLVKL